MRIAAIIAIALIATLITVYSGCSEKTDVNDVNTPSDNDERIEIRDINEDEGWSVGDKAVVKVLDINFRTEPSTDSPRVSERPAIYYGMLLEVIDVEGDWVKVRLASGTIGWIITEYEGEEYIREAYSGDLNNKTFYEYIESHGSEINDFAADSEIYKVYCALFHLDGADSRWTVLYTADSRPDEMLYFNAVDSEIVDIDTEGLLWLPIAPYTGPKDPVSSEEICEYNDISTFIASERVKPNIGGIREGIKAYTISLHLALSGKTWQLIFVEDPEENPARGITGHFDPVTGDFLYADGKMSWE